MAIDTISRALSGQASTAAKQAKETAESAMEQAISAVPGAVSDWLEDNVTPTTPVVDASLSIAGAAADAKATGDGIADLKSALSLNGYTLTSDNWQRKSYSSSTGSPSDTTTRISTIDYISKQIASVTPADGYEVCIYAWDDSNVFQGCWNGSAWVKGTQTWISNNIVITKLTGNYNLRVLLRKADNSTITTIECTNAIFASVIGEEIADLKSAVYNDGSIDLVSIYGSHTNKNTSGNVTFNWQDKNKCIVDGTAVSPQTFNNVYGSSISLMDGYIAGGTYIIDISKTNENIFIEFIVKHEDSTIDYNKLYESCEFTIPQDAIGAYIRINTVGGESYNNDSIELYVRTAYNNKRATKEIKNNRRRVLVDKIGAMVNVAETYFDEAYKPGTHLVYQQKHSTGIFYNTPYYIYDGKQWGDNQAYEGVPCTHCAQFMATLMKGIRYKNSRYVSGADGNNQFAQWAWFSDDKYEIDYHTPGTRDDYMDSKEMADYANKHGFLQTMNVNKPNIAIGDMLFWNTSTPGPLNSIGDISHVALALQVGMESKTVEIMEAWSTTKPNGDGVGIRIRTVDFSDIAYYATFPLKDAAHVYEIIYDCPYTITSAANSRGDNTLFRNDVSKFGVLNKGFYTFIMSGEFDANSMPYINYQVGNNLFAGAKYFVKSADTYICTIYVSEDLVKNNIFIAYDNTKACTVNKLVLVKGFISVDSDFEI